MDRGSSAEETFADFVRARWQATLRLAYAIVLDHGGAEDVAQESFAKLWFRWNKVRDDNPEAYLRRIVVTTHVSKRRRRWWGEQPTEHLPDHPLGADTHRVDERESLRRVLAELSPRQRAVVYLRYAEDLPEDRVADLLGCSVGTVKQHAARGLAALRRRTADDTGYASSGMGSGSGHGSAHLSAQPDSVATGTVAKGESHV